jgi:hypothetical protein
MALCDVALAVLLFVLLRPVSRTLALIALCFRLAQTAVLAANLLNYHAATLVLSGDGAAAFDRANAEAMAGFFLDLHAHGYDLGLLFFGVHCLVLGVLIARSRFLPRLLGYLVQAAGVVYLVGGYTRFLFPAHLGAVAPLYGIPIVAELALCLWLLLKGVNVEMWREHA